MKSYSEGRTGAIIIDGVVIATCTYNDISETLTKSRRKKHNGRKNNNTGNEED